MLRHKDWFRRNSTMQRLRRSIRFSIITILLLMTVHKSVLPSSDPLESIRQFTRQIEFDYTTWTLEAFEVKAGQAALDYPDLMTRDMQHDLVVQYATIIHDLHQVNQDLVNLYSDPAIKDPQLESKSLIQKRDGLARQIKLYGPISREHPAAPGFCHPVRTSIDYSRSTHPACSLPCIPASICADRIAEKRHQAGCKHIDHP